MNTEFLAVYIDRFGDLVPDTFLGNFESIDQTVASFEYCKIQNLAAWENIKKHWEKVHGSTWLEKFKSQGLQTMPEKLQTFKVMSYPDYIAEQNKNFAKKPIIEITAEKYWDLLECLPPVKWCGINTSFEYFFMLEKYSGEWRDQVIKCRINNEWRYFKKLATIADPVTFDQVLNSIKDN